MRVYIERAGSASGRRRARRLARTPEFKLPRAVGGKRVATAGGAGIDLAAPLSGQPGTPHGRFVRAGKPAHLPIGLHAKEKGMTITFSDPLDRQIADDAGRYAVNVWALKRTANYGSPHYNEHPLQVTAATVSEDGKTVSLEIPDIAPTWSMEIKYSLAGAGGEPVSGTIHNTIHRLAE